MLTGLAILSSPTYGMRDLMVLHQEVGLVQVIRSCAVLVTSGSTGVTALDLVQTPVGHRVQSVSSLNPRPLKIIGTHLSARAARVFTSFAPET